jgi:hypothetical protein
MYVKQPIMGIIDRAGVAERAVMTETPKKIMKADKTAMLSHVQP